MADELQPVTTDPVLVALSPADMVPAQASLGEWCDRRLVELHDEVDDLNLHQQLAIENGWKTSVVIAAIHRAERRINYYEKIKIALAEGYLLVPNMPIDILAVRVNRDKQPERESFLRVDVLSASPQLSLPAGVGRYVDDQLQQRDESYIDTTELDPHTKKPKRVTRIVSDDYDDVDFPVTMRKPVLLQAAARAMALRVFDQIGMVSNQGADPILVGQLRDPRGGSRRATFFIAWWVDPRTL